MMTKAFRLTCLAAMLVGTTAIATAEPISGSEIRNLISGNLVRLATPYGASFPLRYSSDGSVTGDGTEFGLSRFFAPRETGEWWIDGDKLCQQFPTWYDGAVSCFTIEQTGQAEIRWTRDDGQSGSATIEG